MDFRELINKIDAVNAEAKKEPERLSFDDAINHVKDITFTPPTQSGIKFSSANNMKFKGKDVNDPKTKLALFQDELKNSPARLLGEIASRIKPSSDAQMDLSGHVGMLGEKLAQGNMMLSQLSKPEQKLAIEVIKQALRSMELERDPDADIEYKDDDEPDAKEMESTEAPVEEDEFDRDSVTYDEVLPYVKTVYKELMQDIKDSEDEVKDARARGDKEDDGGDIDMILPYLRDMKDMEEYVRDIINNPGMDIETVIDYMMPAGMDTSPREELMGRFKKAVSKDPKLAKRLFKDPELDFHTNQEEGIANEENWFQGLSDVTLHGDDFYETFGWIEENDEHVEEAEYQGRNVKLNKPMRGDVKKFKVFVKDPKTKNVKKVNFGDPNMRIKKSNPARRRSFRARHNCSNPGPRTKARYWSCRKW